MLAPLLLGLALAMPATGQKTYLHLEVGGEAAYVTLGPKDGPADGWNVNGDAFGGLTLIPRGVVDDDAPLSLQAYLQRVAMLHVGGAGGAGTSHINGGNGPDQTRRDATYGRFDAWGSFYPHRNLQLFARMTVESTTIRDSVPIAGNVVAPATSTLVLSPEVGLGVRIYDVLLSVGWRVDAVKTDPNDFHVPFYGGAYGSVLAVIERHISLSLVIGGTNGGAGGSATFTGYLDRGLSLWLSINGGHGLYPGTNQSRDWAGGSVGVNAWLNGRFGVSFGYAPTWGGDTVRSDVSHLFTLTTFGRAR